MEGSTKSSRAPALISEKHTLTGDEGARRAGQDARTLDAAEHARVLQLAAGVRVDSRTAAKARSVGKPPLTAVSSPLDNKAPVGPEIFQEWQPTPSRLSLVPIQQLSTI